jgi:hypothetical protein
MAKNNMTMVAAPTLHYFVSLAEDKTESPPF